MSGGCWECRYLSVYKNKNEIFWHYKCRKSFKEMDPENFNCYMNCCAKKENVSKEIHDDGIVSNEDDISFWLNIL